MLDLERSRSLHVRGHASLKFAFLRDLLWSLIFSVVLTHMSFIVSLLLHKKGCEVLIENLSLKTSTVYSCFIFTFFFFFECVFEITCAQCFIHFVYVAL